MATLTRKRWFWVAVIAQVLVLFGMIGVHQYTLATGKPVMLKTEPVAPWDPLRGEYVALRYTISHFQVGQLPMEGMPYKRGQTVWVTLQAGEPEWTAVALSDQKPTTQSDEIAIRGEVEWVNQDLVEDGLQLVPEVNIRYGIEQFYVPEGQGQELQNLVRIPGSLQVEVLVDRFGRAALHRVFRDGQEIRWR